MSSTDRIDQILIENGVHEMSDYQCLAHRIRKAMEQSYVSGRKYGAETANERYEKEVARLNELVKAQKELIDLHEKLSETEFITSKEWDRMDELRNLIKELEK